MSTLTLEHDPVAIDVTFAGDSLTVAFLDGRYLSVPIAWYPRLANAHQSERNNWNLLGGGYAIEWPEIDEHIGVANLLAGCRSGESKSSLGRWLASRKSL